MVWVPVGAAVLLLLLLWYSRRFGSLPETRYLRALVLLVLAWAAAATLDLSTTGLEEKIVLLKIKNVFVVFVCVALFALLASHSGKEVWLTRRNLALLCIVPAITAALLLTLDLHPWIASGLRVVDRGDVQVLDLAPGPWLYLYLFYAYALVAAGVLLLLFSAAGADRLYRRQAAVLMTALAVPAVLNAAGNLAPSLVSGDVLNPTALAIGGTVMAWGLYRYRIFDVRPIARSEVFENMTDAVLVFDANERLIDHNPAAREMLSAGERGLGTSLSDIFPFDRELMGKLRERRAFCMEVSRDREAERKTYEASVMPVLAGPEARGRVVLMRDITERKRAEEALRVANDRLGLLSSITRHDLLNVLTVIEGHVALALEKEDPEKVRAHLEKCRQASRVAGSLIRFTKDYEDLGTLAPEWRSVREVLAKAAGPLNLEGVRMEAPVDGLEIYCDAMVEKVFHNLLDNSLRHGGGVSSIGVSYRDEGDRLVLRYRDDGGGIPAGAKAQIFQRGYGRNTGLGLFLARDVLAITGIEISEVGGPGEGAVFELAVPKGAYRFGPLTSGPSAPRATG